MSEPMPVSVPLPLSSQHELRKQRLLEIETIYKREIHDPIYIQISNFLQTMKYNIIYIPIKKNMLVIFNIAHDRIIDIIFKTIKIIFKQLFKQLLIHDKTIEITGQHNTYFVNGINEIINCMNTNYGCIYCTQVKITMITIND